MKRPVYLVAKRALDLAVALPVLLLASPLLLVVSLAIRRRLGSPVLFRQSRPGLEGRLFTLIKFRSMTDRRDETGALRPDAERLPRFGRLLRATSLDELPTLWNVVRGEISLVGPRPLLVQYLPRYTREQARRHQAKPGITGWAQIHGRNALSWEEKLALDVWYVDHASWGLDLAILARTLTAVLSRRGISHPGTATMSEFMGSDSSPEEPP